MSAIEKLLTEDFIADWLPVKAAALAELASLRNQLNLARSDRDKALRVAEEWRAHNDDFEARLIRVTEAYDASQSDLSACRALLGEVGEFLRYLKGQHERGYLSYCGLGRLYEPRMNTLIFRLTALKAGQPDSKPVICDGCNVRHPFEHRCHGEHAQVQGERVGKPCECLACNAVYNAAAKQEGKPE